MSSDDDDILRQAAEHFRRLGMEGGLEESIPPEEAERRRAQEAAGRELNEREAKVVGVYQHPQGGAFVLLRDSRNRNLPIWIGEPEALSISLAIEGGTTPRPMTHDLTRLIVERLGGTLEYILVDDLHNNVFYAKISMKQGDKRIEIDCRPSDAIALAMRFKCPIYVADHVLEEGQWEVTEEGS